MVLRDVSGAIASASSIPHSERRKKGIEKCGSGWERRPHQGPHQEFIEAFCFDAARFSSRTPTPFPSRPLLSRGARLTTEDPSSAIRSNLRIVCQSRVFRIVLNNDSSASMPSLHRLVQNPSEKENLSDSPPS